MTRCISLRSDYNADDLRALSRSSSVAKQARRLLVLSLIYGGSTRSEAAQHADVSIQTIRDWVLRFNAAGPAGLIDNKSSGTPPRLNSAQRKALIQVVEAGPVPCLDGVVRWRLRDLAGWVFEEYGISLDEPTVTIHGLPEALSTSAPSCSGPEGRPGIQKNSRPGGGSPAQAPCRNSHGNLVAG